MNGYYDIVIALLFAWTAFTCLTKKEALGKKKQARYTKESREKFAVAMGYLYIALTVFCAFYALCNHGVIGINMSKWVYYGVVLVSGIIGIFVMEKIMLVKTDDYAAAQKAGKEKANEEEDF